MGDQRSNADDGYARGARGVMENIESSPFHDEQERGEVGRILAALEETHPARAAYLHGEGTLKIALLVLRDDVRRRLHQAYRAALDRHLQKSRLHAALYRAGLP